MNTEQVVVITGPAEGTRALLAGRFLCHAAGHLPVHPFEEIIPDA
ncbi:hypothetical protein [Nonomuraea sp. NPDC005650]